MKRQSLQQGLKRLLGHGGGATETVRPSWATVLLPRHYIAVRHKIVFVSLLVPSNLDSPRQTALEASGSFTVRVGQLTATAYLHNTSRNSLHMYEPSRIRFRAAARRFW